MSVTPNNQSSSVNIRGANTRAALLEAAVHLFGKHGFDGASIRAIAKVANCNISLISFHFGGKQALYEAVLEHLIDFMKSFFSPLHISLQTLLTTPKTKQEIFCGIYQTMQTLLSDMLCRNQNDNDRDCFLLLRHSMRIRDDFTNRLVQETLIPSYFALNNILDLCFPDNSENNKLRSFLVIEMLISLIRDYPHYYYYTQRSNSFEDIKNFAKIICTNLIPPSDAVYQEYFGDIE